MRKTEAIAEAALKKQEASHTKCFSFVLALKKKRSVFRHSFFVRVRYAEIGLKFNCHAFMSSTDDSALALLCLSSQKMTFFVQ